MTSLLRAVAALALLRWLGSAPRQDGGEPAPDTPHPGISAVWMIGSLLVVALITAVGLLLAESLRDFGVTFEPGDVDLEVYKLTAQVIPTLLIAVSIEAGVKWAKDPKVIREQAGIIAGVGLIAMVGFVASLAAVATRGTTDLAFWLTFAPLLVLGMFVVFFPAYGGGPS